MGQVELQPAWIQCPDSEPKLHLLSSNKQSNAFTPLCFRTGLSWWRRWAFYGKWTRPQRTVQSYCLPAARPSESPESGQQVGPPLGWMVPGCASWGAWAPGEPGSWSYWRSCRWQERDWDSGWQGFPGCRRRSREEKLCCRELGCRSSLWTRRLKKTSVHRSSCLQSCCCCCCCLKDQSWWLWRWLHAPAYGILHACSETIPEREREREMDGWMDITIRNSHERQNLNL